MNKDIKKMLAVVFSGIGGIVLTLLCQYVLFPQSQSIAVVVNGQEYYVTEDDYRTILDVNEHFQALNGELRLEISTLRDENIKLQQRVDELQQANNATNNSAGNNSTGNPGAVSNSTGGNGTVNSNTGNNGAVNSNTGNNGTVNSNTGNNGTGDNSTGNEDTGNNGASDIKGTVRLRNNENINGCPQVNIPTESQIAGQTTYEMTWASFGGATTYRISMWKDANYGMADSNIIHVNEIEVSGLSYAIDLTALEPGYTYGFNVVVENYYSSPLLIELY